MVMTIVEFLNARLDEDEAAEQYERIEIPPDRDEDGNWATIPGGKRHPRKRVLADIAAKRRIVVECHLVLEGFAAVPSRAWFDQFAHDVLRHLASVYVDHPDYRKEWKC